LSPSFNSEIVPALADELLSAQARIEYTPKEGKVYDFEVTADAPTARADILVPTRSVIVPPPAGADATWRKLVKVAPVALVPILLIVEENVVGTPITVVTGVTGPAVRLGNGQDG
jgi:hypothetical protein